MANLLLFHIGKCECEIFLMGIDKNSDDNENSNDQTSFFPSLSVQENKFALKHPPTRRNEMHKYFLNNGLNGRRTPVPRHQSNSILRGDKFTVAIDTKKRT